jgi:hypothetical protein
VKGADGSLITSGVITAARVPASVPFNKHAATAATVAIAPDGTFNFPPLVEGLYRVCPQTQGAWISPCEWGDGAAARILLSGGQASASVRMVLEKGALVTVRVNDPGQFLGAATKSDVGLLIGVSSDSFVFHRAALIAQDKGGRTYQVLVPFDRSIDIVAASPSFQLSSATGNLLAASKGNAIAVLAASGQQPPTVTLNVTGRVSP